MVGRSTRQFIRTHIVRSIYLSRDCRRPVLSMYGRVAQSCQPQERGYQVGTDRPHFGNVLVRDDIHWDDPRYPISFIHRWPRIHR